MKIHLIYKEGTSMADTNKDKVIITMSSTDFQNLQDLIDSVLMDFINEKDQEKAKEMEAKIRKAFTNRTTEWAK